MRLIVYATITEEELDRLIWGIERYGLYPRQLVTLKELRERRKAREVVIPRIWKHYTGAQLACIYEQAMAKQW